MAVVVLAAAAVLGSQPAYGGGSLLAASTEGVKPAVVNALPADPRGPTPIPGLQTPEEAEAQDLALVAAAEGWSVEEAAAHRRATDIVGEVAEKLAKARPDVFVGSVAPSEPDGSPALYVKGPADRTVRNLVAGADVAIEIIDNQPFSFDELEQRKLLVHRALEDRGFKQVSSGFSVTGRGQIDASVTSEPGLPADPAVLVGEFPSAVRGQVRLTVSDEPIASDQRACGGMWVMAGGVKLRTSRWSVYAVATVTTGVTTA